MKWIVTVMIVVMVCMALNSMMTRTSSQMSRIRTVRERQLD